MTAIARRSSFFSAILGHILRASLQRLVEILPYLLALQLLKGRHAIRVQHLTWHGLVYTELLPLPLRLTFVLLYTSASITFCLPLAVTVQRRKYAGKIIGDSIRHHGLRRLIQTAELIRKRQNLSGHCVYMYVYAEYTYISVCIYRI